MLIILIPNALYAFLNRGRLPKTEKHKILEPIEQIGRIGCIAFMTVNIPGTVFGWQSDTAFAIYLCVNFVLSLTYCILWGVFWKSHNLAKALTLSIIPSVLLLFSGVMCRSILLLISSVIFVPAHILISCKDAKAAAKDEEGLVFYNTKR